MKRTRLYIIGLLFILVLAGIVPAVSALATPTLISPAASATLYHYPRVTTVAWKSVAGATGYEVDYAYYDTKWNYYPSVIVNGQTNSVYTFNFVGDQKGEWRVKALSPTGNSAESAWRTFTYANTKPRLATPVKTSPLNATLFYNYPRTTTLTWKPVPGASSYRVDIEYCLGTTCWPYSPVSVTNPSYTFNFVGAQPGRWRLTAISTSSLFSDSATSAWRYFSYYR